MSTFNPQDRSMDRNRGQVLYRYRPHQTFDHVGAFAAQVRYYANEDALRGPALDKAYLIDEAIRFVRRWRAEGRQVAGATSPSDRAPEFPQDLPLAERQYEVIVPGRVYCRVWPLVTRCARTGSCGRVWEAADPRPGVDPWPAVCPRCNQAQGNRQLQYVFVHECGEIVPFLPPRSCAQHHGGGGDGFRLLDQASRFQDFRWECITCRSTEPVQMFCPNKNGCLWTDKKMAPQVHTSSAAFVGHGRTLVNVPRETVAATSGSDAAVIASLALWLKVCTEAEAEQVRTAAATTQSIPKEVIDSINAMEATGIPELVEQARKLRSRYTPFDFDVLRNRVNAALRFDALADDGRGRSLAANLATFERVLRLSRLTFPALRARAAQTATPERYDGYDDVVASAGFDVDGTFLVNEFPVTFLAIGYSRSGFGPREADLVAYKGRASAGQPLRNLVYASPTFTEALVFTLDRARVERWLVRLGATTAEELADVGGVGCWFASRMSTYEGQLPPQWDPATPPDRTDPEFGPRVLFGLLHSMAHQMLRALAVYSGFQDSALSEYLFPFNLAFAIHPNGGSEFTIGGLRTVFEQNLDEIVSRATENATCIYDPNCMEANRGADHGCLLLPETACQSWNWFLSRWDLFGSPDGSWPGYWSRET
jgi:hypothetical protein